MKRSWIKRGSKPLKRSPFYAKKTYKKLPQQSSTATTRSPLRNSSKSEVSLCKKRIQALLRKIAIKRDQGCVLRHYTDMLPPNFAGCDEVLQAEHLHTRGSSGSFGDMRNIVCLCRRHHIYFKPQHSQLYWEIIEIHIGPDRWNYYKRIRDDHKAYPMRLWDWTQLELSLIQDLKNG